MLTNFSHFQRFRDDDIHWILNTGTLIDYPAGTLIIQEKQEVTDTLAILLTGSLTASVSRVGDKADEQEIQRILPGEMLGSLAFIDNRPPATTIVAVDNSRLLALPKTLLLKKLQQDKVFAAHFYQMLSVLLSQQLRKLSDLLAKTEIIADQPLRKVLFVFAILNDGDIDWLISHGTKQKVAAGRVLIEEGQKAEAVYILLDGILGIYISTPPGAYPQKEIAKSVKGEILGEMSFVEIGIASATVKAIDNSILLAIDQAVLADKLNQDTGFASRFYHAIAVVLVDRLRDRLFRRGFSKINSEMNALLAEDIEVEDEINLDILDNTALAGARFDWMIKRL